MNSAVILLGSNTGEKFKNLRMAAEYIFAEAGAIELSSGIYETEPWGNTNQPSFLNQVITISTNDDARSLMKKLLEIERKMGRIRDEKWAPRNIDLDILYFNDEVIDEPGLTIPHPHLHERKFTLVPLCEILPDMIHPVSGKKNAELLALLKDDLKVQLVSHEYTSEN